MGMEINRAAQEWETYIEDVQGKTSAFCIDMAWHDRGLIPAKTCLWEVTVFLRSPRKDGLERPEEGDALEDMGDALEADMATHWGAHMVGWVTRDGVREFYFYMKPPERSEKCVETLTQTMQEFPGYQHHWKVEHDPEWSLYFSFLYPGPAQLRWIQDRRGVRDLDSQGDIASRYRPIHHWMHFAAEEGRDQMLDYVERQGFEMVDAHEEADTELPYWLEIVREDKATMLTVNAITMELSHLAAQLVGEYDGWGCKSVKWFHALLGKGKPPAENT